MRSSEASAALIYPPAASADAHQCAEKALKAVYVVKYSTAPPKIHNLRKLAKDVGLLPELSREVNLLLSDYVISRYPTPPGVVLYTEEEVREKIEAARKILQVCASLVRP